MTVAQARKRGRLISDILLRIKSSTSSLGRCATHEKAQEAPSQYRRFWDRFKDRSVGANALTQEFGSMVASSPPSIPLIAPDQLIVREIGVPEALITFTRDGLQTWKGMDLSDRQSVRSTKSSVPGIAVHASGIATKAVADEISILRSETILRYTSVASGSLETVVIWSLHVND